MEKVFFKKLIPEKFRSLALKERKNVKEGRGVGLGEMIGIGGKGGTTYEFSTSNPMCGEQL